MASGLPFAAFVDRADQGADRGSAPLRTLLAACGAAAAATSVGGGLLLAWRRASGALASPPAPAALLAVTAVGIALVVACDRTARRDSFRTGGGLSGWSGAARFGLVAAVAALAVPGRWPLSGHWLPVVISAVATATALLRGPRPRDVGRRAPARSVAVVPPARRPLPVAAARPVAGVVRQWSERVEVAPGLECVTARIVLAVAAGTKAAQGTVGFCPAFAETPAVEVTTEYDGVEARVAAAEVLPWGVRVECRLAEPAEERLDIPVDVSARGPA